LEWLLVLGLLQFDPEAAAGLAVPSLFWDLVEQWE